jgi:pimeloyl-ACP methyl ester carboxylesterase
VGSPIIVAPAMAWLDRDGVRLYHEVHKGPADAVPLLLSHGFSASAAMWSPNAPALAERRHVVAWDMRGHARSDAPADQALYSHELSVGDMAAVLDAASVPRAALCGMSLGGDLSLAFRLRHPEGVAALVLVDTGPGYRRDTERDAWNAYCEQTAADLEARGLVALRDSPEVADHPDAGGLARAARGIMAQRDAAVIESLEAIDVPTLVVVGSDDEPFLRAADYLAARIPGARKLVVEGAGHAANVDAPELFNAAVNEFLEGL